MKNINVDSELIKFYFYTSLLLLLQVVYTVIILSVSKPSIWVLGIIPIWISCISFCLKTFKEAMEETGNKLDKKQNELLDLIKREAYFYGFMYVFITIISFCFYLFKTLELKALVIVLTMTGAGIYAVAKVCNNINAQQNEWL
jgi:hypothetical protein